MKKILNKIIVVTLLLTGYTWAFAQGDAELILKPSSTNPSQGEEFSVDIVLENPDFQKVISVRSWLDYDPMMLEVLNIETDDSPFTLSAPGEDNVSVSEGRVKIGRSNITGGMIDAESTVATVKFKVLAQYASSTTIDFYDYQVSELGHTSVNIIDGGFPLNILSKAPEGIQLQLNPGGVSAPTATPDPVVTPTPTPLSTPTPQPEVGGGFSVDLARPMNLKVNTGAGGYVDLKWEAELDSNRTGFNIYYGQTSGQYSRRRSVGNVGSYRINGLNSNETYYFAVTAYDSLNRESDYSNEAGIIIGEPLSSTNPFEGLINRVMAQIPQQPQSGPLVGWLGFSAVGLSATMVFGRKKRKVSISNI